MSFLSKLIFTVCLLLLCSCASKKPVPAAPITPTISIEPLRGLRLIISSGDYYLWYAPNGTLCWTQNPKPGTNYPECPATAKFPDWYSRKPRGSW